jgi:predicted NAD/FAD-binding protein
VVEGADAVTVALEQSQRQFDQVIVATQANHVAQLCPSLPEEIHRVMTAFVYEDVPVVVHTDRQFMPKDKRDWSVFNFETAESGSMCTVWLNKFHTQWPEVGAVFQTIKPLGTPSPESIICSVKLQRPVVTTGSYELWRSMEQINHRDSRIKFCGSYAVAGIPLLESAVVSAQRLVV